MKKPNALWLVLLLGLPMLLQACAVPVVTEPPFEGRLRAALFSRIDRAALVELLGEPQEIQSLEYDYVQAKYPAQLYSYEDGALQCWFLEDELRVLSVRGTLDAPLAAADEAAVFGLFGLTPDPLRFPIDGWTSRIVSESPAEGVDLMEIRDYDWQNGTVERVDFFYDLPYFGASPRRMVSAEMRAAVQSKLEFVLPLVLFGYRDEPPYGVPQSDVDWFIYQQDGFVYNKQRINVYNTFYRAIPLLVISTFSLEGTLLGVSIDGNELEILPEEKIVDGKRVVYWRRVDEA